MLEGKAYVKDTDMPLKMQVHAMDSASQALDLYDVVECTTIAAYIKKVGLFVLLTYLLFL
ncbi:putative dynein light chain, type, dynein light chain superfamily protein [Helianthus annuus]|nr:putative dynein light chain, type, dynein light chain superfamily protein [Helianthus annuus]